MGELESNAEYVCLVAVDAFGDDGEYEEFGELDSECWCWNNVLWSLGEFL